MRYIAINAVTSTASGVINTTNTSNMSFQFTATGISSGNGVLTLLGSNDGINFVAVAFIDPTPANTNAQNITRLTSLTLSSNATKVGCVDPEFNFEFLKFTCTVTTDGSYSVLVYADAIAKT